jgi:hypothetical protein
LLKNVQKSVKNLRLLITIFCCFRVAFWLPL